MYGHDYKQKQDADINRPPSDT